MKNQIQPSAYDQHDFIVMDYDTEVKFPKETDNIMAKAGTIKGDFFKMIDLFGSTNGDGHYKDEWMLLVNINGEMTRINVYSEKTSTTSTWNIATPVGVDEEIAVKAIKGVLKNGEVLKEMNEADEEINTFESIMKSTTLKNQSNAIKIMLGIETAPNHIDTSNPKQVTLKLNSEDIDYVIRYSDQTEADWQDQQTNVAPFEFNYESNKQNNNKQNTGQEFIITQNIASNNTEESLDGYQCTLTNLAPPGGWKNDVVEVFIEDHDYIYISTDSLTPIAEYEDSERVYHYEIKKMIISDSPEKPTKELYSILKTLNELTETSDSIVRTKTDQNSKPIIDSMEKNGENIHFLTIPMIVKYNALTSTADEQLKLIEDTIWKVSDEEGLELTRRYATELIFEFDNESDYQWFLENHKKVDMSSEALPITPEIKRRDDSSLVVSFTVDTDGYTLDTDFQKLNNKLTSQDGLKGVKIKKKFGLLDAGECGITEYKYPPSKTSDMKIK